MVVRLRKGPSGPLAEDAPAGASAPLMTARWVDPATLVDPGLQDGSEAAPFSTITAALTDLEAGAAEFNFTEGALYLAPGDYAGENVNWITSTLMSLTLQGLGSVVNFNSFTMASFFGGDSSFLKLTDIGNPVEGVGPTVTSTGALVFIDIKNSTLPSITTEGGLRLETCTAVGNVTATEFHATSTTFSGVIDIDGICTLDNCQAIGPSNIDATVLRMQGCNWQGAIDASDVQLIDNYIFVGVGPSTVNSLGTLEVWNTRLGGDVTAVSLIIDTVSYQAALAGSVTFTIAVPIQVIDSALAATIVIAVPAVAAGSVAYVNTSLVGTPLENVFQGANSPVIVNPNADLVVAGAGGGFINARISATNNLRSAFLGPLAGGNANFTVCRGR